MEKFHITLALLMFFTSFTSTAWADETSDLRAEMAKMREEYQSEIKALQAQVTVLLKDREKPTPQAIDDKMLDSKIEEKLTAAGIDYVGRYDGPFEKGGLIYRPHSGFGSVSVGGYADMEFENFNNTASTFDQHRWIINIGAELGERLRFFSEYEIEHGGPDANNAGDGEAKVEQAWIDYLINEGINFRTGAVLVPFGRYNLYHDSDLQDLTDRPLVTRDVIPTTWTEAGAGFYGEFNPTFGDYEDLVIGYEAYIINGLDSGFSDTGLRGGRGSLSADNNNRKSIVSRVVLSPGIGHELGVSGYFSGKYNNQNDSILGFGIDGITTWGPWEFLGEAAYFKIQEPAGAVDFPEWMHGAYVQANYHFWFDALDDTILGRSFEDPTFTAVTRFGYASIEDDLDGTLPADHNKEQRWTLGLNYRPVESWVMKLEYQFNNNENENLERGNRNGFMASVAMGF